MARTYVAGVGMTKFTKPGQSRSYRHMGSAAIAEAIADAGIDPSSIETAFAAYVYGDSTSGQNALYDVMQTGIPIINVNNNCASGSTALYLAREAVRSGAVECALAFGFEEMAPGPLSMAFQGMESPLGRFTEQLAEHGYPESKHVTLWAFGAAAEYYVSHYDADPTIFAKVAVKSRRHAIVNPYSLFTQQVSEEEVLGSPLLYGRYLHRLMACPPTNGAAAAVVCSEAFARKNGVNGVEVVGQAMTSDTSDSWADPIRVVGTGVTRRAAEKAYAEAGLGPEDVDVIEMHDCFTNNEVLNMEALGLCDEGGATKLIVDGDNTYGGRYVVGPSGGLMSKGHPLGATGLAQCFELVNQLRGNAGARQVEGASVALQHNLGLGSAGVVTIYRK
ncbi:thiolase C-terminal domain-containing protein [Sphingobium xenophagum]|uniref:thiolase C-terminal domain-containing protein n=1 Tax=Sphingobium xenophagum TaxID=121428 RepID=UPI00039B0010|nr:lipid-transfer protein [Sphingobium xenophagum]